MSATGVHMVTVGTGVFVTALGGVIATLAATDTFAGIGGIIVALAGLVTAITGLVRAYRQRAGGPKDPARTGPPEDGA